MLNNYIPFILSSLILVVCIVKTEDDLLWRCLYLLGAFLIFSFCFWLVHSFIFQEYDIKAIPVENEYPLMIHLANWCWLIPFLLSIAFAVGKWFRKF